MSDKQLKDKAVDIKGKKYVLVADRILYFNQEHPNGCIETRLVSPVDSQRIVMQAIVTPDVNTPSRVFNGYSQEVIGEGMINKTSALENSETSAVGRALAMMGIGVIESIASVDEINKAENQSKRPMAYATAKQIDWLRTEARKVSGLEEQSDVDGWIAEILTIPPHKVPVFKVKNAVELIQSKKESSEIETPNLTEEEIGQAMDDFNDGKLPY